MPACTPAKPPVLPALLACAFAALASPPAAAQSAPPAPAAAPVPAPAPVLLLGEVHDNPDGHRARLALLQSHVDAGWHPAIAMEQFDRERQPDLDRAQRECKDAACVVAMAAPAKAGWHWAFYAPVIDLALREHLPLYAANLSRADAGRIVERGWDKPVPVDVLQPQVEEVRSGHCGMLPDDMLAPMATAQVARDEAMAAVISAALAANAGAGVALLAGNGHVRRDIGVPVWLRARGVAYESVGFVEDSGEIAHFDRAEVVPAFARPDPCAKFKPPATP
jgi:uncharacterized iron-regulated protein